jgi:16S rRNA (guanine1207-N2)-methyltransferase
MLQSRLLCDEVIFHSVDHILVINSAEDPFVLFARQRLKEGMLTLAEDNVAAFEKYVRSFSSQFLQVPFHSYVEQQSPETMDVAAMSLLYQPSNAWMLYGLSVAALALKVGGRLYVAGAKDRGILSQAKRMQELFGNVETLTISKGQRVLCSEKRTPFTKAQLPAASLPVFADNKLDEGTRLLLDVLEVLPEDNALDLGSGAGFIGVHMASRATQGHVTMVDASLAAVAASQQACKRQGLTNVEVLASNGVRAIQKRRFDLVATNPPFHQGGIQTREIAERFMRETARILEPQGRFYLVANRFLKYEPTLEACFRHVTEVGGNTRYKVLRATNPIQRD